MVAQMTINIMTVMVVRPLHKYRNEAEKTDAHVLPQPIYPILIVILVAQEKTPLTDRLTGSIDAVETEAQYIMGGEQDEQ
jgi:hypothetical protein